MDFDAEPICYGSLLSGCEEATTDFCERLHRHGYALLRFPPEAVAEVQALRALAAGFFALPPAEKNAIGDFRFVGDTYSGYRDSASIDAEFLERLKLIDYSLLVQQKTKQTKTDRAWRTDSLISLTLRLSARSFAACHQA